ncbi:hypothetical protein MNV49_001663 [Pseudohyphozyma bogoriensis]|nr:hypothetical protein MNV49_001663 [Pseudohyphozyma bogoriensis]
MYRSIVRPLRTSISLRSSSRLLATESVPKPINPEGIAFKAPSEKDTTVGQLGQVFLPDMQEQIIEAKVKIVSPRQLPSEPDNYTIKTDPEDAFPSFHAPSTPQVLIVASESAKPVEISHGSSGDDVQLGQDGDSTASLAPEDDVNTKYTFTDRELTSDERIGALALGGILVGGFLLGGLAGPKKQKPKKETEA